MERTLHKTATDAALKMMSSEQLDATTYQRVIELKKFIRRFIIRSWMFGGQVNLACKMRRSDSGWLGLTHYQSHPTGCRVQNTRPALASLINLLEERDLLESTLVICGGEFGRTPRINPAEGRDHWPHGFPMFLAGCGIGKGESMALDPEPNPNAPNTLAHVENPVTISDLHATIYAALGISPHLEYQTPIGRPIKRSEGQPIKQILA